jgi:hypothetical protein
MAEYRHFDPKQVEALTQAGHGKLLQYVHDYLESMEGYNEKDRMYIPHQNKGISRKSVYKKPVIVDAWVTPEDKHRRELDAKRHRLALFKEWGDPNSKASRDITRYPEYYQSYGFNSHEEYLAEQLRRANEIQAELDELQKVNPQDAYTDERTHIAITRPNKYNPFTPQGKPKGALQRLYSILRGGSISPDGDIVGQLAPNTYLTESITPYVKAGVLGYDKRTGIAYIPAAIAK